MLKAIHNKINNLRKKINNGDSGFNLMTWMPVENELTKKCCLPLEDYIHKVKDTRDNIIKYYYRNTVNTYYKYVGNNIKNCGSLRVDSLYEDINSCLIAITLMDTTGCMLCSCISRYIIEIRKAEKNNPITDAINAFKDFYGFVNIIKDYRPRSIRIYSCETFENGVVKDFRGLSPRKLDTSLRRYLWLLLMAGVHHEHYLHGGKEEELDFKEYKSSIMRNSECYKTMPTTLLTLDQYASSNFIYTKLNKVYIHFILVEGIPSRLYLIASMLRHNSNFIDDHLDEVGGMVWEKLKPFFTAVERGHYVYSVDPNKIYNDYVQSTPNLETSEGYIKAIEEQLPRYTVDRYDEDTSKGVIFYTLESKKSIMGNYYVSKVKSYSKSHSDYPVNKEMLTKDSIYLGYKKDNLNIIESAYEDKKSYVKSPERSFNIEEYKKLIKDEYDLIPELRELIVERSISRNNCRPIDLEQEKLEYVDLWTMVVLDDLDVAFYLGGEVLSKKDYMLDEISAHYFISLNGKQFKYEASHNDYMAALAFITEKEYESQKFKKKYPKICAMYERGYKLYHEYVAHGESNTMTEILKSETKGGK